MRGWVLLTQVFGFNNRCCCCWSLHSRAPDGAGHDLYWTHLTRRGEALSDEVELKLEWELEVGWRLAFLAFSVFAVGFGVGVGVGSGLWHWPFFRC